MGTQVKISASLPCLLPIVKKMVLGIGVSFCCRRIKRKPTGFYLLEKFKGLFGLTNGSEKPQFRAILQADDFTYLWT